MYLARSFFGGNTVCAVGYELVPAYLDVAESRISYRRAAAVVKNAARDLQPCHGGLIRLPVVSYGVCGRVVYVAFTEIAAAYLNVGAEIKFARVEFRDRIVAPADGAGGGLLYLHDLGGRVVCLVVVAGKHTVGYADVAAPGHLYGVVVGAVLEYHVFKQHVLGAAPHEAAHLALHVEHTAGHRKVRAAVAPVCVLRVVLKHIGAAVGAQHGKVAACERSLSAG